MYLSDQVKAFFAGLNWLALRTIIYTLLAKEIGADLFLHHIRDAFHINLLSKLQHQESPVFKSIISMMNGNVNGLHSRMKQWIDLFKGIATKYLDNYLAWFLFIDSCSNENTKHNIKEFLLSSFVFEMTDTYDSLRLSKFNV